MENNHSTVDQSQIERYHGLRDVSIASGNALHMVFKTQGYRGSSRSTESAPQLFRPH